MSKTDENIEKEIIEKYKAGISAEKIAKEFSMNASTICRILKRNNIEIRTRSESRKMLKTNSSFIDIIDTTEKAYFIGFMYSSGMVSKDSNEIKISIHNEDKDILEKFISLLFIDCSPKIGIDRNNCYLSIVDKQIREKLIEYGCGPNKTFNITFPTFIKDELMSHFLRGFYDGVGSIGINKDRDRIHVSLTGYKNFLLQIKEYFKNKLNIDIGYYEYGDNPNLIDLTSRSFTDCKIILNFLYKDCSICLDRKFQMQKRIIDLCTSKGR